jgi:hypothetical protein
MAVQNDQLQKMAKKILVTRTIISVVTTGRHSPLIRARIFLLLPSSEEFVDWSGNDWDTELKMMALNASL